MKEIDKADVQAFIDSLQKKVDRGRGEEFIATESSTTYESVPIVPWTTAETLLFWLKELLAVIELTEALEEKDNG